MPRSSFYGPSNSPSGCTGRNPCRAVEKNLATSNLVGRPHCSVQPDRQGSSLFWAIRWREALERKHHKNKTAGVVWLQYIAPTEVEGSFLPTSAHPGAPKGPEPRELRPVPREGTGRAPISARCCA